MRRLKRALSFYRAWRRYGSSRRGAFAMALTSHVRHKHPDCDPAIPPDPLYADQGARMRASRPLYQLRRRRWTR